MTGHPLTQDSVWLQQRKHEEAEAVYQAFLAGTTNNVNRPSTQQASSGSSLVNEIAQARQQIQKALNNPGVGAGTMDLSRIEILEKDNRELRKVTEDLRSLVINLEKRINVLEGGKGSSVTSKPQPAAAPTTAANDDDDDDDVDLFGSSDEDEKAEQDRLKAQRVADYNKKKSAKPKLIAKSSVMLDVKPWGDDTDMKKMEEAVRTIEMDGLKWGAAKLAPIGYGISKLQILCIVEDEKVSIDDLTEKIEEFEDYVQSVDIAAFNKI